jgi:GNAT superfamily N-acetyltransferase
MSIVTVVPDVAGLREAVASLREWQFDRAPMQLHPGDLGWHWRDGPESTAAAVRVWSRAGQVVAMGLLDAPQLLRMAIAPDLQDDHELIDRVLVDLHQPERGVLGAGGAVVEARCGPLLTQGLLDRGWQPDEPWTPLHLSLTDPVLACGLRVETIGPEGADEWLGVHWSAFRGTTMGEADRTTARDRWFAMAASAPYAEARCLTAYDEDAEPVAIAGVWSAGPGRPGLLEPIGVLPRSRGHGHGRAVTLAAAAALRDMGSSSATVCTPSAQPGAVETYASAGFERFPEALDLRRPA